MQGVTTPRSNRGEQGSGLLEQKDREVRVKHKQVQPQLARKRAKGGQIRSAKLLQTQSKHINIEKLFGDIGI